MNLARMARFAALLLAAGALALLAAVPVLGSDHQDTPEVELNPRCDINDVYAFPNPADDSRICLVMTTSSPISAAAAGTASFDSDKLYQLKIDNTPAANSIEDLVLQFTFEGSAPSQTVTMRGPVAPVQAGTRNKLSPDDATVTGNVGASLTGTGANSDIQLYCGVKDDPFFLDLEQFFRIIPDRKPVSGGLSTLPDTASASSFRPVGQAVDYLAGFKTLAIVVEMPKARLTAGGVNPVIGIWGTISR